jgi:uncharacterized protein YjbI with pentapeptide repeats
MLEPSPSEAPNFAGANFSGAHVLTRLNGVDMHGANLTGVHMGMPRDQLKTPIWNDLSACNLSNANLTDADLQQVRLAFANLTNADLSGANLVSGDLTRADLTGANVAGANLTGVDLDGTVMRNVKGLKEAKGLDHARNWEKAVRLRMPEFVRVASLPLGVAHRLAQCLMHLIPIR